jgi:uncharacterized protein YdcH (DUF465 family)
MSVNQFTKLFDNYHELERQVHHIGENNEPGADEHLDSLNI